MEPPVSRPPDTAARPGGAIRSFPVDELPSRLLDPLIGKLIGGRYQLITVLARGGQGRFYKARNRPSEGLVVLLILKGTPEPAQEPMARAHFLREARLLAGLNHPALPQIIEIGGDREGELGEPAFVAMEYVEGQSLQERLAWERRMDTGTVLVMGKTLAEVLEMAHGAGLCHGDLKPGNIVFSPEGRIRLLGFGLGPVLHSNSGLGAQLSTGSFFAPEQIEGAPASPRTDIYSLGLLLGLCLAGQHPGEAGRDIAEWLHARASGLRAAPILGWAVYTALKRQPSHRFAGMQSMRHSLELAARQLQGDEIPITSIQGGHLRPLSEALTGTLTGRSSAAGDPGALDQRSDPPRGADDGRGRAAGVARPVRRVWAALTVFGR